MRSSQATDGFDVDAVTFGVTGLSCDTSFPFQQSKHG
jgi:hypothetical protein